MKAHGKGGPARERERLFRKVGRRAGLFGGEKYTQRSGGRGPTSVPVHEPDVAGQPPVQQIPERVLIRESLDRDVPKWLPELPPHQELSLRNSMATAPPPPSRGSLAQTNPTLQRLRQNLEGAEDPLPPPPQALFARQSTFSSIYAESVVSSAPSSRPSTIVYASPLRPRPSTRRAPR